MCPLVAEGEVRHGVKRGLYEDRRTMNDHITMPSVERAMMAKTAHSQSLPPGVMCRSAFGGFWSSDDPAIVRKSCTARELEEALRGKRDGLEGKKGCEL